LAETSQKEHIRIRVIGIYVIIILALIRFLVYPLNAALQGEKTLLGEWYESYRLKSRVFEQQKEDQGEKGIIERSALLPHIYDKGIPHSNMQVDVLEQTKKLIEKNGLTVLNFEILEPIVGKGISEVPILIRLRGQPGPFIEILKAIEKGERALSIRSMEITRSGPDLNFSLTISSFRLEK